MSTRGFTLLEVLVALAILALVLVTLLRMEVSSISLAAKSSLSFRALVRATAEVDELERMQFTGELKKESEPFVIQARTEIKSYQGIPLEKMTLQVLYEDRTYSELYLYNAKAF